jgi:hypothetical protein
VKQMWGSFHVRPAVFYNSGLKNEMWGQKLC